MDNLEEKVFHLYKESSDEILSLLYFLNNDISMDNIEHLLKIGMLVGVLDYRNINIGNYNYHVTNYMLTKYYKRLITLEQIENGQ